MYYLVHMHFLVDVWFIVSQMGYMVYNLKHVCGFKLDKVLFSIITLEMAEGIKKGLWKNGNFVI